MLPWTCFVFWWISVLFHLWRNFPLTICFSQSLAKSALTLTLEYIHAISCKWFVDVSKVGLIINLISFEIRWVAVNPLTLITTSTNGWLQLVVMPRAALADGQACSSTLATIAPTMVSLTTFAAPWRPTVSFWWRICAQAAGVKKVLKSSRNPTQSHK